jgi:hypothetical protein
MGGVYLASAEGDISKNLPEACIAHDTELIFAEPK